MRQFRLCILAATLASAGALAATVAAPTAPGQPAASCLDRATGVRLTPAECAALGLDTSGNPLKTGPSPTSGSDAGPFPPALGNSGVMTAQAQSPQAVPAPLPARTQSPAMPPAPSATARSAAAPATPAAPAATQSNGVAPAISPTRQWIIEQELDRAEREARDAKAQADAASGTANPPR